MSETEPIRIPRGTVDLTGELLERYRAVEGAAHAVFARFGYREIRTPLFELTRLFARAVGESTDIVEKEMFTIPREGESYSLRPEGTAAVVRHYVENSLHASAPFQKLCYVGPFFRYERPQAGRQRQFGQVGIEAFGSPAASLDVEVVLVLDRLFRELGIDGYEMRLNTIGCHDCRPGWREKLLEALRPRAADLCGNCRQRMERNVLRVLDCKREGCREIVRGLPKIEDLVCDACRDHYAEVRAGLSAAGVAYTKAPYLVRGLDYYTRTVFEAVHPSLGAQDSICGGGRYDGLVQEIGGPATPATGFAVGIERLLLVLQALGKTPVAAPAIPDFYVVAVKDEARPAAFALANELRDAGLTGDLDYEGRGLKAQMKKAARFGARVALVLGPGELERGTVTVRRLSTSEQEEVAWEGLATALRAGR